MRSDWGAEGKLSFPDLDLHWLSLRSLAPVAVVRRRCSTFARPRLRCAAVTAWPQGAPLPPQLRLSLSPTSLSVSQLELQCGSARFPPHVAAPSLPPSLRPTVCVRRAAHGPQKNLVWVMTEASRPCDGRVGAGPERGRFFCGGSGGSSLSY